VGRRLRKIQSKRADETARSGRDEVFVVDCCQNRRDRVLDYLVLGRRYTQGVLG
jgi:hypothetical protein